MDKYPAIQFSELLIQSDTKMKPIIICIVWKCVYLELH